MTLIVNHHIVPFMEHQMTYCFSQTSKMAENKMMKEIRYLTEIEARRYEQKGWQIRIFGFFVQIHTVT